MTMHSTAKEWFAERYLSGRYKYLDGFFTSWLGRFACRHGVHRLYEWVGNHGTGIPSIGVKCFRCDYAERWTEQEETP